MGRPPKTGVDYFPHMVKHGETMFVLEEVFGNDGYATWFKILETLGTKEGHFINCQNGGSSWEYLKAKTRLDDDKLTQIINLLAKLSAIDPELWSNKIIWCQHFVDGIEVCYKKRRTEIPSKPASYQEAKVNKILEKSEDEKLKSYCRNTLNHAIEKGLIKRGEECQVCGSRDLIDGHHNDYSKPLDVIWLCRKHHYQRHLEIKNGFSVTEKGDDLAFSNQISPVSTQRRVEESREEKSRVEISKDISCDQKTDRLDECPHQKIIDLYHEILPELPKVRDWGSKQQAELRQRWLSNKERQDLEFWSGLFKYIRNCDFLMGKVDPKPGFKRFHLRLRWLVNATNFAKVIEGDYEDNAVRKR